MNVNRVDVNYSTGEHDRLVMFCQSIKRLKFSEISENKPSPLPFRLVKYKYDTRETQASYAVSKRTANARNCIPRCNGDLEIMYDSWREK